MQIELGITRAVLPSHKFEGLHLRVMVLGRHED